MTEELFCGCMKEVWLPRQGSPSPQPGQERIAVYNPDCALHVAPAPSEGAQ